MKLKRLWIVILAFAAMGTGSPAQTDHAAIPLSVSAGNWTTTNDDGVFADSWVSGGHKFAFILTGQLDWPDTQPLFEIQFSGFKPIFRDNSNVNLTLSFDNGHKLELQANSSANNIIATLPYFFVPGWTHDLATEKTLTVRGLPGGTWTIPLTGAMPTVNAFVDAILISGASDMPDPFKIKNYNIGLAYVQPITEVADFTESGYRFVVFDRQITRKDLSVDGDSDQNTKIEVQIPQIIDPLNKQAAAFNKKIIDEISLIRNAYGMPSFKNENSHNNYVFSAGLETSGKEAEGHFPDMLPGVASFALDVSTYCNGCKPQNEWPDWINWVIAKERPVEADDIFDPSKDWKTALLYQACTRSSGCQLLFPTDLIVEATYPGSWLLSQKGLLIEYSAKNPVNNQYDGTERTVFVPWSSLKPYLKEGGLVSAGS